MGISSSPVPTGDAGGDACGTQVPWQEISASLRVPHSSWFLPEMQLKHEQLKAYEFYVETR